MTAGFKKAFAVLILLSVALSALSCSDGSQYVPSFPDEYDETTAEPTTEAPKISDGRLHIIENYLANVTIVYSERADATEIKLAESLASVIQLKAGVAPEVKSDYVASVDEISSDTPEILIGLTNRRESVALNAELDHLQYAIATTEAKLAIVGKNVSMLELGIKYFTEHIMTGPESNLKKGDFSLNADIKYIGNADTASPKNLMNSGLIFDVSLEAFGNVAAQGEHRVLSGGCTDGENYYAIMRSGSLNVSTMSYSSVVVKYSLPDMTPVAVSNEYDLGGGADMTYDALLDRLVIAHGSPDEKKVSYMTTGLLNLTSSVSIGSKINAICALGDGSYAAASAESGKLFLLDKDLAIKDSVKLALLGGDIVSIDSDGTYIYVLTNAKTMINVYTLSGKYVNRIALDSLQESKNISVYGDGFLIGFCDAYWSRGDIFTSKLSIKKAVSD